MANGRTRALCADSCLHNSFHRAINIHWHAGEGRACVAFTSGTASHRRRNSHAAKCHPHAIHRGVCAYHWQHCSLSNALRRAACGHRRLIRGQKLMGIEKLICSMASCTDMRVRKNIAILLAKGCRDAEVRERVTALRGMQMIVELQHKF